MPLVVCFGPLLDRLATRRWEAYANLGAAARLPGTSETAKTILLVDDQPFVGMALERLLAAEGDLHIDQCIDAEAAVGRANEIHPDLILQDLVMPKLDGLTLVRMFRQAPATAGTPIVVLSGNDDAESRERAIACGANDYLVKLPPAAELVACLRRNLAGHAAPATSPRSPGEGTVDTLVPELADQFMKEVTAQAGALIAAARRNDTDALATTAHRLKGSAAMVGAGRLAALCAQLEHDLDAAGPCRTTLASLTAITEEINRLREVIDRPRERAEART